MANDKEWFFVITGVTDRGDSRRISDTVCSKDVGWSIDTAQDLYWAVLKHASRLLTRDHGVEVKLIDTTFYHVQPNDLTLG